VKLARSLGGSPQPETCWRSLEIVTEL